MRKNLAAANPALVRNADLFVGLYNVLRSPVLDPQGGKLLPACSLTYLARTLGTTRRRVQYVLSLLTNYHPVRTQHRRGATLYGLASLTAARAHG